MILSTSYRTHPRHACLLQKYASSPGEHILQSRSFPALPPFRSLHLGSLFPPSPSPTHQLPSRTISHLPSPKTIFVSCPHPPPLLPPPSPPPPPPPPDPLHSSSSSLLLSYSRPSRTRNSQSPPLSTPFPSPHPIPSLSRHPLYCPRSHPSHHFPPYPTHPSPSRPAPTVPKPSNSPTPKQPPHPHALTLHLPTPITHHTKSIHHPLPHISLLHLTPPPTPPPPPTHPPQKSS